MAGRKGSLMTKAGLADVYRDYIACLNARAWPDLGRFVHEEVTHNGDSLGLAGYRRMLEGDVAAIPDLHFDVDLLVVESPLLASRLGFRCTPRGRFLDLNVNGRAVSFSENVFYRFRDGRIVQVWSVIDKLAIEAQLRAQGDAGGT